MDSHYIYGQNHYGWDWYIACTSPTCQAFVETMPNTFLARHAMVSPLTRRARIQAHKIFDLLWEPDTERRTLAYKWLQEEMGMTKEECHIRFFNLQQCQEVIRLVNKHHVRLKREWEDADDAARTRQDDGGKSRDRTRVSGGK